MTWISRISCASHREDRIVGGGRRPWEYIVLGICNYNKTGKLDSLFRFIAENDAAIDGDILEAGSFRGRTTLALGLFLKEIGSTKQVYGFDTFGGFPPGHHDKDDRKHYKALLQEGRIGQSHYDQAMRQWKHKEFLKGGPVGPNTVSNSGDFSDTSPDRLKRKIDYLGLDNIHLIQGPFSETMISSAVELRKISVALIDCDLYESYVDCLPFIWDRLVKGGFCFIDEYYSLKFPGARLATDEFFSDKADKPYQLHAPDDDFERWAVSKRFSD